MSERTEIIDTITRLFWSTDHHAWDDVEAVFADRVLLDYTSLQGGEPATLAPAEIVGDPPWTAPLASVHAPSRVTNRATGYSSRTARAVASESTTNTFPRSVWRSGR